MQPLQRAHVLAVVPARNEADVIAESIDSLLNQSFNGELEIIVVDDNSTDQTAEIAGSAGAFVLRGAPLAEGWTGKLWAMQQGVEAAASRSPDYFLFSDADIYHDPHNVASLVGIAQARNLDLASHMVKLHCKSWAEKFTIPAFVYFFFKLYPPAYANSAAGGCILLRPSALSKIGGLAAIRNEVIDDCSLAKAIKRQGGRLWIGLTAGTTSIRPYKSLSEIYRMIARSAFSQLHHSVPLLLGSLAGLLVTYILPPLLAVGGSYIAMAAWAIMTICYLPMIRFYGLNPVWALTLPVTACFYAAATVQSAINYRRGKGGQWKGRVQDR